MNPAYYSESSLIRSNFASITLDKTDRIRLLLFTPDDINAIRNVIKQNWSFGIQDERSFARQSHEFKCNGRPWQGKGSDAIWARVLVRAILAHLFAHGWILTASTDVSRSAPERDTMIFRKQPAAPPSSEWIAISFNQSDRLRLIGAPPELVGAFHALLTSAGLCQDACWKDQALNAFEFKIHGRPWNYTGQQTITTQLLLLRMLETLEQNGWSLYATVLHNTDVTHDNHTTTGKDSWYCVRALGWMPGNSGFHR